jgi:hypothetical protein
VHLLGLLYYVPHGDAAFLRINLAMKHNMLQKRPTERRAFANDIRLIYKVYKSEQLLLLSLH